MRRHAKAPSAAPKSSQAKTARRKLLALATLTLLASLALGVSLATAVAPTVTIEAPTGISNTTAKLKGTVDPGDHETFYRFEFSTAADFSGASSHFGSLPAGAGSQPVEAALTALAPDTTYYFRLVASNEDGEVEAVGASTFTTLNLDPPNVTIDNPSAITADSAHLSGTINPKAPLGNPALYDVTYRFQCEPSCGGLQGDRTIAADSSNHPVSDDATGLSANTEYRVKLIAANAGTSQTAEACFRTGPVFLAPESTSLPSGPVTETTAVVGGWVDPNGSASTYRVEYATEEDFSDAQSLPATEDAPAGSCKKTTPVSLIASDLKPDTDYFFRIVSNNVGGEDVSEVQSFHTLAPLPPQSCPNEQFRVGPSAGLPDCRAYEKLSPNDKNGGNVGPGAVLDDGHATIQSSASFLPEDPFYADNGRYLATRSSVGWGFEPILVSPKTQVYDYNQDLTQAIIAQSCVSVDQQCPSLVAEDTEPAGDVYSRDASGTRLVSQGSVGGNDPNYVAIYAGQSEDGSHVLFETTEHLEPEDPADGPGARTEGRQIYERVGNQTRVVGLDSNEQLVSSGGAVLGHGATEGGSIWGDPAGSANAISGDGSTIFFESPDPGLEGNSQLYARLNGEDTVHVSASKCEPACGPSRPAVFFGASEDGSRVYFVTAARLLEQDDDDSFDLYQYRLNTDTLTLVTGSCEGAEGLEVDCGFSDDLFTSSTSEGPIGVSDDGRRIYFTSPPKPAGEFGAPTGVGAPAVASIWLYDESVGGTRFVAATQGALQRRGISFPNSQLARMDPSGDTLAFYSSLRLTAYDNVSEKACLNTNGVFPEPSVCGEFYRFRADTGAVECVSCSPSSTPRGSVDLGILDNTSSALSLPHGGESPNQLLSDDGQTVVFQTKDPLSPADLDKADDVYEWREGRLSLLSPGGSTGKAEIAGITRSGKSIFFTTYDALVPRDTDDNSDLYGAIIEGGLAVDHSAIEPVCAGEGCRGGTTSPTPVPDAATPAFSGVGNKREGASRCAKGKVRRAGKCRAKKNKRAAKQRRGARNQKGVSR